MADHLTTQLVDLLREMKGPLQTNYASYHVMTDNIDRQGRARYCGKQVTIPLFLNLLQGGGALSESGTVNTPQTVRTDQAVINMKRVVLPVSISPDALKTSGEEDTSWIDGLGMLIEKAFESHAVLSNIYTVGDGDGLLGTATATTNNTTVTVAGITTTTGENFFPLYVGGVYDIRTKTTYAAVTNGAARRCTDINRTTGVLTFGDGGGNINVTTTTDGIFIQGAASGTAPQGIQQVLADHRRLRDDHQGAPSRAGKAPTARAGVTTSVDLSIPILDGAETEVGRFGKAPSWYIGDERCINKYGQTLLNSALWGGDKGTLETGWTGISYRDKVLIHDYHWKRNQVAGICPEDLQFYGYEQGPTGTNSPAT